jgi:hypothetical protein
MTATATATSAARRSAGIDRRTVGPALLVLALAVLMSVVLPSIDSATSYRDQVEKGDVAEIADGLTMLPASGGTWPRERSSVTRARRRQHGHDGGRRRQR